MPIYEIQNTLTGIRYLGSSRDIAQRWWRHRRDLNRGSHHNRHLQRSWAKHGAKVFRFSIIQPCLPAERFQVEQTHLDGAPKGSLFNAVHIARGGTWLGQRNSPEHNAAIGRANRGRPSWNKGGTNTWAAKAAHTRVSNYTTVLVGENLDGKVLRFTHIRAAARQLGIGRKSIENILHGFSKRTRCGWVFRQESKE